MFAHLRKNSLALSRFQRVGGTRRPIVTRDTQNAMQNAIKPAPALARVPEISRAEPNTSATAAQEAISSELVIVPSEKRQERPHRMQRYRKNPNCLNNSRGLTFRKHAGHLAIARYTFSYRARISFYRLNVSEHKVAFRRASVAVVR